MMKQTYSKICFPPIDLSNHTSAIIHAIAVSKKSIRGYNKLESAVPCFFNVLKELPKNPTEYIGPIFILP